MRRESNIVAEFMGWYSGDGCVSITQKYSEFALAGDITEELPFYQDIVIPTLNEIFKEYLTKPIGLRKYPSVGVCGAYIFDKTFVKMLIEKLEIKKGKKKEIHIPTFIRSTQQKIHFLRGIFDTDGSIFFERSRFKTKNHSMYTAFHYKPRIKLSLISRYMIEDVYNMCKTLGFSPILRKPYRRRKSEATVYSVVIDKKDDIKRWISEIGYKNQKHITKVMLWNKFGFCPPFTNLEQRRLMLDGKLNPLTFYPKFQNHSLKEISKKLCEHQKS